MESLNFVNYTNLLDRKINYDFVLDPFWGENFFWNKLVTKHKKEIWQLTKIEIELEGKDKVFLRKPKNLANQTRVPGHNYGLKPARNDAVVWSTAHRVPLLQLNYDRGEAFND